MYKIISSKQGNIGYLPAQYLVQNRVCVRFRTGKSVGGENDMPWIMTPTLINHTTVVTHITSLFLFQMATLEATISALGGKIGLA